MFQVLQTNNFRLRELREDDVKEIFLLRSDPEVNKYLDREPARTFEDAREFISKIQKGMAEKNMLYWVIEREKFAGTIGFWNFGKEMDKAEIGYELLPQEQGKGIIKEILPVVIEFGFRVLELRTIEATTDINNIPSRVLLEKNKFRVAGEISKDVIKYELKASEP